MAVFDGSNVRIDYGDLELTEALFDALFTLNADCYNGCGGTWEIFEEGDTWRAVFLDMATDELVWDADEGAWTDDYDDEDEEDDDEEDDEDEDDEDEEYMLAFVG